MNACSFAELVDLIGDRWSLLLVGVLLAGPRRTTELAAVLSPISTRTLAERLKRLEAAGVLTRRAFAEAPPRVEYTLTARGHELRTVIDAIRQTAAAWDYLACETGACRVCDADPTSELPIEAAAEPLARRVAAAVDVTLL
jgi:DNA-binding HxlR family transcriptional regulator